MLNERSFDRHYYGLRYLYLLFAFELFLCIINLFYIFCRIPSWAMQDFYPIRVGIMFIMMVMVISFGLTTLLECISVKKDKLHPTSFLRHEIGKAFTVITWAWIIALCLSSTLEHHSSKAGNFACFVHAVIITVLLAGLPYALLMYYRDRKGHFDDRNSVSGWRYENGEWVKEKDAEPQVEQPGQPIA